MTEETAGTPLGGLARLFKLSAPSRERWSPAGVRRIALLTVLTPAFLTLQLIHWVGFVLDDLLFPSYRRIEIREPLFVVGLPRSGTTFVQRALAQDDRFTTMTAWELLVAPSIVERKTWLALQRVDRLLGRPVGRLVARLERAVSSRMAAVHPASLGAPEEDHLLLLPAFGCILLVLVFPRHPELWRLARLDSWPPDERRALLDLYQSCLQRHLYVAGPEKTVLSKNPSFTGAILTLADAFPDARFLCCVRDPTEAVPSQLSSVRSAMGFFGVSVTAPDVRERFVSMMQHYAEHALTSAVALPEDRFAFVALSAVRADLRRALEECYAGFRWEITSAFRQALEEQSLEARSYASAHRYALQDFGLSSKDLEVRFAAFTERFGFDELAAGPTGASRSPTGPSA